MSGSVMSEASTPRPETRVSIASNGLLAILNDVDNINNRMSEKRGRMLGQYQDEPEPVNKPIAGTEPDRCDLDQLDFLISRLNDKLIKTKDHLAALEEA